MADGSVSSAAVVVSNSSGSQISPNIIIAIISSLFILVLLYPWIIAVTLVSFVIGFTGLEHFDKFIKTSILSGRFGPIAQARFKDYIGSSTDGLEKNVIKQVTADPLRDLIEETEEKKQTNDTEEKQREQLQKSFQLTHGGLGNIVIQNTLIVPARLSSSNRSSPEKSKPLFDSPKRSLSAASSRRVSEDIPGFTAGAGGIITTTGVYHHQQQQQARSSSSNKTPSPSKSSTAASLASTPSSIALNPEIVGTLRVDQEFRVDIRVDKALGRLCTNIINYYISPSWAPYETRRQLKLCFKQLLNSVAEQCSRKLLLDSTVENVNAPIVKLAREKLLPLVLHYLDKILSRGLAAKEDKDPIISAESMRCNVLKIRKFCKQIFDRFLRKDDRNCKLWTELCVAVLADGVFVNVMILGRDKLPELLEELAIRFNKKSRASTPTTSSREPPLLSPSHKPSTNVSIARDENSEFVDPLSENFVEAVQEPTTIADNNINPQEQQDHPAAASSPTLSERGALFTTTDAISREKVPFLLDHFLDPPYDMDKPDPIVSRWRPTLKDIVSETDLLYPLIQYMKHVGGQQSLAYLQGVLDEFPQEGDPHCRRVLELEYLPGFCRSSLFLETMGLSRVEMALEVGADPYSIMRRNSSNGGGGHTRSASYGGPSSSSLREFLKLEQGVVDGLPLTESSQQNVSISSSSSDQSSGGGGVGGSTATVSATLPAAGEIQPSLAFKRRPHLEMYIAKFIKSTSKSWKQYYDPLAEQYDPVKRAGIDAKSYEEWNHPIVNSRVKIESSNVEIYDCLVELVTSLMRSSPIASPFFSGLANFVKPYLMHTFNEQLDKNLTEVLSQDLLVTVVDLIADVFEEPSDADITDNNDEYGHFSFNSSTPPPPPDLPLNDASEQQSHEYHNSSCTTCDPSFKSTVESLFTYVLECFMLKFVDLEYFVKCFSKNREFIFLFFVDLLDVLVGEIVEE